MGKLEKRARKEKFFEVMPHLCEEYKHILFVNADNVSSNQMQQIRRALRGKAVVLMGKNTMMRKSLRTLKEKQPTLEKVLPLIKGNVGFVFTNEDLHVVRDLLVANKKQSPARVGSISPVDVIVPAGPTGMEPTQTSFLQALDIQSKIVKGQVEIISDVLLIKKGEKVGQSEAALLKKLNINPFLYGLEVLHVYDEGSVYSPAVLDLTDADILGKIREGIQKVTALSLEIGVPTVASVSHSVLKGYKNVLALSLATEYTFKQSEQYKEFLKDPSKFAAAAPAAPAKEEKKEEEKKGKEDKKGKEEKKKKEEPKPEEEDTDMGLSLFG